MPKIKYYCDNEVTGDPVLSDERRYYPIHIEPEDPPLIIQAIWIGGIAVAAICFVLIAFSMV